MKILVTGGTGYIGEHFIPLLLSEGHEVRLLVRNLEKGKRLFGNSCTYFIGDVTDRNSLIGCCSGIDVVFHMIAKVGNQLPSADAFHTFNLVNVDGTRYMIEESKKACVKKFIFVSSIAAMGIVRQTPITEKSKCEPYLPYQVSKFEAEQLVIKEFERTGFPGICIRPTKVFGVGEHEYSYLTLAKLCKKGIFPKVGSGNNYTSNIYITDFVGALKKLLVNGIIGETYILSSSNSISFTDVGKLIAKSLGKKIIILPIPARLMILAATIVEKVFLKAGKKPIITRRNIESTISDRVYDLSKSKREIGYVPKVTMEAGIKYTIEWYVKNNMI